MTISSTLKTDRTSVRRRGVALVVAIAVLAILTILVMGLAASQSVARHHLARSDSERQARSLARTAFEAACAALASMPGGPTAEIAPRSFPADGDSFTVGMRPATSDDDPVYAGKFLKPRPGDVAVTVTATHKAGVYSLKITQTYLANVNPAHERRILLSEEVGAPTPAAAPAGDAAAPTAVQ
ncbi:hypothetical protein JW916_12785 [Candidatus Sumerlaeota bacterium]|nr:hypothetical protein [Candidatus Sumerlaeota bacterium]